MSICSIKRNNKGKCTDLIKIARQRSYIENQGFREQKKTSE